MSKCPACGFDNPEGFAFCGKCGARLTAPAPRPSLIGEAEIARLQRYLSAAQFEALPPAPLWQPEHLNATRDHLSHLLNIVETYLPRYLVQAEVEAAAPTGGEFLSGALLFADISGFTAMSERLSALGREGAEQITEIVNRYFGAMLEVIFACGGDLFKFGGDALLAFFPDTDLPGSLDALRAAWAMQQAMTAFHRVETSLGVFPLQMKIGLNAGAFFAARLGTAAERQFMLTGSMVNATARAESLAEAGQIVVGPLVYQQASGKLPVAFAPGAAGHFIVSDVREISMQPRADERRRLNVQTLSEALDALDRLTPYLPAGLLARLTGDPHQRDVISEHRLVSVLFANFRGASELIEQWGMERAAEIAQALDRYYVTMQQAIGRYDGVVNKIDLYDHGDKLMALFGAPIAHEDDAERAVRAALDMQAAEPQAGPLLTSQRIGVSTGLVFAGQVGSPQRREYTVMGDEVNLSARLMSAATEGELLLSGYVARKVSPFFDVTARGEVRLKGKSKPVPVYVIVGRKAQPEPVRGIQGLSCPMIGRDKELAVVQSSLEALRTGRGNILALIGEAGLGKSRLLMEWKARSRAQGDMWLESQCMSYTQNISYYAFIKIVREALGIFETDNAFEMWIKMQARIQELMPAEAQDILPYLAHLLSLPLPDTLAERVRYLEGETLQRQIVRSVAMLLEHLALRQPLVLVFDDLHWADTASLATLERCLAITDRAPALICLIYRPDRERGCWALGQAAARNYPHRYTEINLKPLDTQAGQDRQMVCTLLNLPDWPPALAQLVSRAEGNPFYIEEIIRALIDAGAIVRTNGNWQLVQETNLTVPHTLQGIIMTRLDRLAEPARRMLQLASVIGRTFRYVLLNGLAAATGLAASLGDSLALSQRAGLVRELTRIPELEYGFVQALFRDVAYDSLLIRDRRTYHRLVAQQLESGRGEDERQEIYEVLAYHYSLSDDPPSALNYLVKAGDKTRRTFANKEAIAFYRQAEALAEQLDRPADRAYIAEALGRVLYHIGEYDEALACYARALAQAARPEQRAELHRLIGAVHEKRGEYDQALASCAHGMAQLAPSQAQTAEMARLLILRCRIHHQQGSFEQAIADGEQALAIVQGTTHYREIAQAHNELGNAYEGCGQFERAADHFEQGLTIFENIGDEHAASQVYNNLALIYYQTDLERSAGYMRRVLATMQKLGDVWGESTAYQNLGIIHYTQGNYDKAVACYQRSLEMKERLDDRSGKADCHLNLGEAYRAQRLYAQAIAHLKEGLIIARQIGAVETETQCHRQLAECSLEMNEPEGALVACQVALDHARNIGDRQEEGVIYRVMGNAHLQLGALDEALARLEQSITILRELKQELDLAGALCDYARALKQAGQPLRAREQLQQALEIFKRLQLPQDQARVRAALEQT